jgi:hypothetical protein
MPSTASTRLRLEKQATGENLNTWGTRLNTVEDLIEFAVAGRVALTVSGPVSLTANLFVADQARGAFLDCTGTGGTSRSQASKSSTSSETPPRPTWSSRPAGPRTRR